jgi:short-subunit dehydrogenase
MVQITMIDDGNMDLSGKTILITGATAGIGKATGMELAKMGADVILVGRDSHKTQETVAEIKADTGNTAVTGFTADLSSPSSSSMRSNWLYLATRSLRPARRS